MAGISTAITVRVIAKDGKFIGDDVGSVRITITDSSTGEILLQGNTSGNSGANGTDGVMCSYLKRGQPVPTVVPPNPTPSAFYTGTLLLTQPRRITVSAVGPLDFPSSANMVTQTTWIIPGKPLTGGNGVLLEMPGLLIKSITPSQGSIIRKESQQVSATVAMMCGCPISNKSSTNQQICPCPASQQPWLPREFDISAVIAREGGSVMQSIPLQFNKCNPEEIGVFNGQINALPGGTYTLTILACQPATGNTGVGSTTFAVQD